MQGSRRAGYILALVAGVVVILVLATLFSAASPSASPTPVAAASASTSPTPSPVTAAPSRSPTPTPTATASAPTPGPTPDLVACATAGSSSRVIRLERVFELGIGWIIAVYDDGRVITPGVEPYVANTQSRMVVRQLSPLGIETLLAEITATGLFGESASYEPVPLPGVDPPGRGGAGYTIAIGEGADEVRVGWTSLFGDDALYYEPSPEREQLDQLGEWLVTFADRLASDAWVTADPCAYRADRFRVFVEAQAWGGSLESLPPDVTGVAWPLGGAVLDWGRDVTSARQQPPYLLRCDVVTRDDADLVRRVLRSAGARAVRDAGLDGAAYVELELGDRDGPRIVSVVIQPLLPDERGCTGRDLPNPFAI